MTGVRAHHGPAGRRKGRGERIVDVRWIALAEMPRLDAFDEEFAQDPESILRERRRRIVRRLWTIAAIVLGVGTIAALALAWSKADGRLRLELQSVAPSPRSASRERPEEELDRLHREVDALRNEVGDLTQAQDRKSTR